MIRSKTPLFLLFAGYISSSLVYFVWYYIIWHAPEYKKYTTDAPNTEIVVVMTGLTALYLFLYALIRLIESFQTTWASFLLVSIITVLSFFIIPTGYFARYEFTKAMKKVEAKRTHEMETKKKLQNLMVLNVSANKSILELQAKLETVQIENDRLKQKLTKITGDPDPIEKEHKTTVEGIAPAKSKKDFSKGGTNSEAGPAASAPKVPEIIFKVQILSSSTRLAKNAPEFKGITNVSEYKDDGLHKYTVGDQKDLKSAFVLQSELRKKGLSGAFVTAFNNGKRIPIKEALKLLK